MKIVTLTLPWTGRRGRPELDARERQAYRFAQRYTLKTNAKSEIRVERRTSRRESIRKRLYEHERGLTWEREGTPLSNAV